MKKQLLIISAFLIGTFSANAQITITSSDVATPIKVIYQSNDTLLTSGAIVGSAGISQTWNMTSLTTGTVDTLTFEPIWWNPDASFPTSNMVIQQGFQNFVYATISSSALTIQGSRGTVDFGAGPTTIKQYNTPSEILMNFPATYLTAYTNNFKQVLPAIYFGVSGVDSVRQRSAQKKTVLVDAWGTLTTPLSATAFAVIRSKETVIRHDTTDIMIGGTWNPFPGMPQITADSTTGYSWWANGVGFPLVSIKLDSLGAVKQAQWLQALPMTGINELTAATNVNVYLNPAQNEINFGTDASKVAAVEVYDITGKLVKEFAVNSDNSLINTSGMANGQYSYTVLGKDKTVLNHGKFTIAK